MAFITRIMAPFRKREGVYKNINFGKLYNQPTPYCNGIVQQDFSGRSLAPKVLLEEGNNQHVELEEGGNLIDNELGFPPDTSFIG